MSREARIAIGQHPRQAGTFRRVGEEKWEWDLDLGLLVRAAWFRQVLFGLVVAFFLAVPPIVGAYQNSNLLTTPST